MKYRIGRFSDENTGSSAKYLGQLFFEETEFPSSMGDGMLSQTIHIKTGIGNKWYSRRLTWLDNRVSSLEEAQLIYGNVEES